MYVGPFWLQQVLIRPRNNPLNVPKITNRWAKSQKYRLYAGDFPQTPVETGGLVWRRHEWMQAGHRGFIEYRPPKINSEYWPNIDHTALYRPNFDHKSSLKSAHVFTRFATKVRMFIRAGLYPTSQEIQGAGRYFHMTSFNGRVHFEVLRFVIFQIIGKIYHHSERFWWNIDHFNAISTTNSRISTI